MKPEEKSRQKIDQWLRQAGWKVINRNEFEANSTAVAVREGLLKGNKEVDYFLFINGKAIAVLEAKREEIDVSTNVVCDQVESYARGVPNYYTAYQKPIPFLYTSNGKQLFFRDFRKEDSSFEEIFSMHKPKKLVEMLGIDDPFAGLPMLNEKGLRKCQYDAIVGLEQSFKNGEDRALMILATGAGKTYTACMFSYRFLAYTPMKRILFLVDRNNLGKQAEGEFGTFRLTENGESFNNIYSVNRLKSAKIPSDSNVVISTIQRLFSLLKGDEISDTDDDDSYNTHEVILPENPNLPHDFFDLIIIDECHRSIYGNWRKVLEYFDTAKIVGLTATPIPDTKAFFNENIVADYDLKQSIIDGVNVDCRIYRIKTQATEEGGAILEGDKFERVTCYTGQVEEIQNKETINYTKEELNRSIINPSQIKLILQTYKEAVYRDMFNDPQREANFDYLPKTLIFALNETHANNIVRIAKEVFERKDERFVQKITYSTDSNELIRQFRNDKDFRIAVTCTLVATGTDIKPLEVVMFMRDVESLPLYVQMKGRGVRTIGDEQLRNVTPNAFSKDCYFLVDAVGVTEHEHSIPRPGGFEGKVSLETILEHISHGYIPDYYLDRLASSLFRIYNKATVEQHQEFIRLANDNMQEIALRIHKALEESVLPPFIDTNHPNIERKALVASLACNAKARQYILILHRGFIDTLIPGEDTLISQGFSLEEARNTTEEFEDFCINNKDKIEALRIIYNNKGEAITYPILKDLENKLKMENSRFSSKQLWNSYAIVFPNNVRLSSKKEEAEALTNIIQLVRFAYHQIDRLESVVSSAGSYFNLWVGHYQRNFNLTEKQREIMSQIANYIAYNGACTVSDIRKDDQDRGTQLILAFSNMEKANQALQSVFNFIVYKKAA
jgi:type I restriction enzyme R subunit